MNHIGEQIGIHKVLSKTNDKDASGHIIYEVECTICHRKFYVPLRNLHDTTTTCHHSDNKIHEWKSKRLASIFRGMKRRCNNPNDKNYATYGGKGIKVDKEWIQNPSLFENWAFENGYQEDLTIDRIDENKDYCPENCQWIPLPKNSAKKSTTHYVTVYNETHSGREWSHILHKGVNFINTRVRKYGLNNIIEYIKSHCVWKDGRVVECNGLESRQPQLGFADSNSAPSAK